MKLHKHYSTDECNDNDLLFERLNELQDENKITFSKEDIFLIKIVDIDLSDSEEQELVKFLDSLDLYPFLEFEDDYDQFNEDEDLEDYSRSNRRINDDYDDY